MIPLHQALRRVDADLRVLRVRWALIGGLAVSVLAEPRTTKDVDVVIAVRSEADAEKLILALRLRGYDDHPLQPLLEEKGTGRLLGVRRIVPVLPEEELVVDLMFGISGVEPEIVASAPILEVAPGLQVPVASSGHLLALKILAGRPIDRVDAQTLLAAMDGHELNRARETLLLISRRGFDEDKDLLGELKRLLDS